MQTLEAIIPCIKRFELVILSKSAQFKTMGFAPLMAETTFN
jgi:hypothetical protein